MVAFWIGGVIGRYCYPYLDRYVTVDRSPGALLALDRSGNVPRPVLGPNTTPRELVTTAGILLICCYMAFSAGASNVANAVAPLVGSGALGWGRTNRTATVGDVARGEADVSLWIIGPSSAAGLSYLFFSLVLLV